MAVTSTRKHKSSNVSDGLGNPENFETYIKENLDLTTPTLLEILDSDFDGILSASLTRSFNFDDVIQNAPVTSQSSTSEKAKVKVEPIQPQNSETVKPKVKSEPVQYTPLHPEGIYGEKSKDHSRAKLTANDLASEYGFEGSKKYPNKPSYPGIVIPTPINHSLPKYINNADLADYMDASSTSSLCSENEYCPVTSTSSPNRKPIEERSPDPKRFCKGTSKKEEEYRRRRERNNIAVRKSRQKAKQRILQTQERVMELTEDNERLKDRCDNLQRDVNVLKAIINSGNFVSPDGSLYKVSASQILAERSK